MPTPDPSCPQCHGVGFLFIGSPPPHPPTSQRCPCVIHRDILANLERALPKLSTAPSVPSSPLTGKTLENVWVTEGNQFLSHLRHVGLRQPPSWNVKVVSDAELVTSWLSSTVLRGHEILDPDAYTVSTRYMSIPDLVIPPDLVVIRMGIKVARNQAASEVLAEALQLRYHEGKPTWLWDEPAYPMNVGHMFWSDTVGRILSSWERVQNLTPPKTQGAPKPTTHNFQATPNTRKTLRGGT